jgi:hypothetical protein
MNDDMVLNVAQSEERRAYTAPAIVHELKLETRAGSPLRPEVTDPLGIDPTQPHIN